MTKNQKIWLWIFLGMFLVPELLWSPVLNYFISIIQGGNDTHFFRQNTLVSGDHNTFLAFIFFIQLTGLIGSVRIIAKTSLPKQYKVLFNSVAAVLIIINIFILYLFWGIGNIKF